MQWQVRSEKDLGQGGLVGWVVGVRVVVEKALSTWYWYTRNLRADGCNLISEKLSAFMFRSEGAAKELAAGFLLSGTPCGNKCGGKGCSVLNVSVDRVELSKPKRV